MSDNVYSTFQHYGTNAERLAFVPDPAVGIQPIYIWYETDTGNTYVYYTSWVLLAGSGGGASASLDFLTHSDETASLPNSRQLLAGTNVTFDDSVAGERTIDVTASAGLVLLATVTRTNAQILALPSGDVTLVAAPGAGNIIVPIAVDITLDSSAGAYTNVHVGCFAAVNINSIEQTVFLTDDGGPTETRLKTLLDDSDLLYVRLPPIMVPDLAGGWWAGGLIRVMTGLENAPLVLHVENGGAGDFTGGNAANSMQIDVWYVIKAV